MTLVYLGIGVVIVVIALVLIARMTTPVPPQHAISDEDIRQLLRQGKRIQAISWYRTLHGVGLKDAKTAVDEMIRHL